MPTGRARDNETTKGSQEWKALNQDLTAHDIENDIDAFFSFYFSMFARSFFRSESGTSGVHRDHSLPPERRV